MLLESSIALPQIKTNENYYLLNMDWLRTNIKPKDVLNPKKLSE